MRRIMLVVLFASMTLISRAQNATVAKDGSGNYNSVQAAINAAPTNRTSVWRIYIKNGTYTEVLNIPSNKPYIQLQGQSLNGVKITYSHYSGQSNGSGGTFGTFNSATVTVNANFFSAINVQFENSHGAGAQAVALIIYSDKCTFKNCRFLGYQDTLCTYGQDKWQSFQGCYIEGAVDFIFGNSRAYFDGCTINCKNRSGGVITAANTANGQTYGLIFNNCTIQGSGSFYLGRPWQNDCRGVNSYPKTVFLNTTMSSVILPVGWMKWDDCTNTSYVFYAEYNTKGVSVSSRVSWSKQLNSTQASTYARSKVFSGWDPNAIFSGLSNARMESDQNVMVNEDQTISMSPKQIMTVFPNPSSDLLHLSLGNEDQGAIITITDVNGKVVFTNRNVMSKDNDFDISSLSNGTYVITALIGNKMIQSQRFQKKINYKLITNKSL